MPKRQSPDESATEFAVGTIRVGNDGKKWIIAVDKNGRHRWKKHVVKISGKSYFVHDNGGRPFKVTVSKNNVSVQCAKDQYGKVILKFSGVKKVFVGRDPKSRKLDGNTILVRVDDEKYAWIGEQIIMFSVSADDPITQFISRVGNSDVPYPYASNKTHVFLVMAMAKMEKSEIKTADPYHSFYELPKRIQKKKIFRHKVLIKRM